ncbi:hypothetical protein G8S49_05615 [Clostridium botulinum C]|uniref:Uncharacterized protein n=2 Tax=Clostridium botulinum TaxID=1491 RepID=A0A9Q4XVA3_CLOBO|nr:hypothetical protein [Clostridium botulinum]MCD3194890.1 hypothetical protein [Clostridium botulinum C]MCD3200175.1 hypothetical protein [Clostridium botulinum C]MCD3205758.1 hypothetical protein [Clostridium botulinum C]MCD3207407.1 hypothetical protein [Clostridium botulinum C]MCD3226141.1 hypothetical protein [Clostridium botulinum C]
MEITKANKAFVGWRNQKENIKETIQYITSAVRFNFIDDLKRLMKILNKDRDFKPVKVKYELEDIDL